MKAIYLKFPNEQASEVVKAYECRDVEGYSVDVVGLIDGVSGWHVNMLVPDDFEEFKSYEVNPVTPNRVFAGWN